MISAIEYFETKWKMCKDTLCDDCELGRRKNGRGEHCLDLEEDYPNEAVEIVEKWGKEYAKGMV